MNDEQLGNIERHIDAWMGEVTFDFSCSGTKTLRFRIRAGEYGPSAEQKRLIQNLELHYEELWPSIFAKLEELRSSANGMNQNPLPKPRLLLSVPGVVGSEIFDLLLGYEFDGEEAEGSGYFFGVSEWELRYATKASLGFS